MDPSYGFRMNGFPLGQMLLRLASVWITVFAARLGEREPGFSLTFTFEGNQPFAHGSINIFDL